MIKKIILLKLKIFAKLILRRYKPRVVGITGSVGKTGTKEAVYAVLKDKARVGKSDKNYNNEFGLPLSIIGMRSPGRSLWGWIRVFLRAMRLLLWRDRQYPEILALEMGVDHPGDMDYLTGIVKPDIGVVTAVGTVHAEHFGSVKKLYQEKLKLVKNLSKGGWAILNYDNEKSRDMAGESRARVMTYGLDEKADVQAREVQYSYEDGEEIDRVKGISFKINYAGSYTPVLVPGALGINAVYAALAAAAAGLSLDMNLVEVSEALKDFQPPRGRMCLIPGIKHTNIIDDTYNSEPDSAIAALGALRRLPVKEGARRFAVLGDMLELGRYSEEGHRNVGRYAARAGIDKLILVGERSRDIGRGAEEAGMKTDYIFNFDDADAAKGFVQDRIKKDDLILVKGSQGIRTEKIVKEIMAEPLRAEELLVRQEKRWLES